MNTYSNPDWWTPKHESLWERTKAALKRDWDQTVHDVGGDRPDTDQDLDDTVKQAAGKQPIPPRGTKTYEIDEAAHRFGVGARAYYGKEYARWNDTLESRLKSDWIATNPSRERQWNQDKAAIRYGWDYDETAVPILPR